MPTFTMTKNWDDGQTLTEAMLDDIKSSTETFLNTTKLDADNLQDLGVTNAKLAGNITKDKLDTTAQAFLVPVGAVMQYVSATIPSGWLECNGDAVSQTTYAALFAVIGTTYNTGGEGAGNFRLPDHRGRAGIGRGTGTGLTARTLGASLGHENFQAHTHDVSGTTAGDNMSHTHGITLDSRAGNDFSLNRGPAWGSDDGVTGSASTNTGNESNTHTHNFNVTSGSTGSGNAGNMQPSLVFAYIIKT